MITRHIVNMVRLRYIHAHLWSHPLSTLYVSWLLCVLHVVWSTSYSMYYKLITRVVLC